MELLSTVPLLIIDDLGMRKLGPTAAEELLEIVMRRYGRASTVVTSNRKWGAQHCGDLEPQMGRTAVHGELLNWAKIRVFLSGYVIL